MRGSSVAGPSGAVARGGTSGLCVRGLLFAHAVPIGEPRPPSEEVMSSRQDLVIRWACP